MSVSSSLAPSGRRDIHHEQVAWVMKNQDDGKKCKDPRFRVWEQKESIYPLEAEDPSPGKGLNSEPVSHKISTRVDF